MLRLARPEGGNRRGAARTAGVTRVDPDGGAAAVVAGTRRTSTARGWSWRISRATRRPSDRRRPHAAPWSDATARSRWMMQGRQMHVPADVQPRGHRRGSGHGLDTQPLYRRNRQPRCRAGRPAGASAPRRRQRRRHSTRASVEHVDAFSGLSAGWLVQLDVVDGHLPHAEDLPAGNGDKRGRTFRPTGFIPSGATLAPSPHADERSRTTARESGGA